MANMGLGELKNPEMIFKRKFRWELALNWQGDTNKIPTYLVKLAARPSLTVEETPINFLNGRMYIPGKAEWETLSVTFYDVSYASASKGQEVLYNWLASVYDFTKPDELKQNSKARGYGGTGILTLYDGCGVGLEKWTLTDLWPTSVNFGDLDYSSSDEVTIEVTLRFSTAAYESLCPGFTPSGNCLPCSGGSPARPAINATDGPNSPATVIQT